MISVIISTYNRPQALKPVLLALSASTGHAFEVVIADDGSTQETSTLLQALQSTLLYPLIHVRQSDRGFRAARARNKAVAASSGEYLIFLDGDCIPRSDFLTRHLRLAEPGWFVRGNRVMLSPRFTERVLERDLPVSAWPLRRWLLPRAMRDVPRILPLLRLPAGPLRRSRASAWQGAKTCNLGVWREDFIRVDGFDERFTGWGHEDAEFVARLLQARIRRKEGIFATCVLHLWHPFSDRADEAANIRRLERSLHAQSVRAGQGFSRHSDAP